MVLPHHESRAKGGMAILKRTEHLSTLSLSFDISGMFRLCFENSNTSYSIKMESILPYEVEGHCCAFHNGYVYIIGGYDGISVVDTIIRYNVSDGTSEVNLPFLLHIVVQQHNFQILPTRLSTARENHVCEIIFDRYVVVMAGWDGQQALDSVEIFEISEGSPYLIPTGNQFNLCQEKESSSFYCHRFV
ncbi:kelch repeat protein, partial [Cooperia oncophora]